MNNRIHIDKIIYSIIEIVDKGIDADMLNKDIIKVVIPVIDDHREMLQSMSEYAMDAYYSIVFCDKDDENPIYDMVGGVLMSKLF